MAERQAGRLSAEVGKRAAKSSVGRRYMGAKLKRKSFFVDEGALRRAKKALRAKTDAEVVRLSVEHIAGMVKF